MRKLCSSQPLLFSLITALLFLQWSTTHIHLAGEHEHHGAQHQHAATVHQHRLASHHGDVIDVADETLSHVDSNKVVELEYVSTQFHGNPGKLFAVIPTTLWKNFKPQTFSKRIVNTYQPGIYQSYHQYSLTRLRAPPLFS
ncbi:MAG: hypothetical protein OEY78_04935 [Gammaproteobacteria bacterium]|nr:hypothetical protein [Gammaproteobacteria bacterium]